MLLEVGVGLIIWILKIGHLFLIICIKGITNILKFFGKIILYLDKQLTRGFSLMYFRIKYILFWRTKRNLLAMTTFWDDENLLTALSFDMGYTKFWYIEEYKTKHIIARAATYTGV